MDTPGLLVPIVRLRCGLESGQDLTIGVLVARSAETGLPHLRVLAQAGGSHVAAVESIPDKVRIWAPQDPLLHIESMIAEHGG
jgi:hypothetical protein